MHRFIIQVEVDSIQQGHELATVLARSGFDVNLIVIEPDDEAVDQAVEQLADEVEAFLGGQQ